MSHEITKSVLTIQSHVVHGYVGNKTSTFPLQVLGWDVDVLNTVQLSNHTGYGKIYGQKLSDDEIWTQYEGLINIGMDKEYDAVLTGYVPSAKGTATVSKIARDIVEKRQKAIEEFSKHPIEGQEKPTDVLWVLDPVIGDHGRFYVSEDVIPVYRDTLKSGCVSIITPNQFEAEILADMKITTKADVLKVLAKFHTVYKVKHVVITSLKLQGAEDKIWSVGSTFEAVGNEEDNTPKLDPFYYEYPSLSAYITGTGDLFAAILVDRLHKHFGLEKNGDVSGTGLGQDSALSHALGEVLGVVQAVIKRTIENPKVKGGVTGGVYGNIDSMKNAELRLIQSIDLFPKDDSPYKSLKYDV